jgi:uncharacterized protein YbaP (TraB family)
LVVLFFLFAHSAIAEGPVWKVSKGEHHVFIGGTIHLLGEKDYPLPTSFYRGYDASQIVVFEIDPDVASSPEAQQKFNQHARYNDDRTLKSVLNNKTYTELSLFLSARGMSISSFEQFKPSMLSVVLTVVELQRLGLAGIGVDEFFNKRAKKDGKQRLFLETIDDQFNALLSTGEGKENQVIVQAIDELEKMSEIMQQTKQAWRQGDNNTLMAVALAPWVDDFPKLYQALLVNRNLRWIPQIKSFMKTSEVEYVLVGALHLVGPDGLLALMKAQGYQVERFH